MKIIQYFKVVCFFCLIIPLFVSCSEARVHNRLIGRWKVDEAVFSTGDVLKNPDMILEFSKTSYTVYTKGEISFSLDYKVKKDLISHYIETFVNGKRQGERVYFSNDNKMHLELSSYFDGQPVDLKYYLSRIE